MDKLEKLVAEQLAGEEYEITDWKAFNDVWLRRLVIHVGNFYVFYQQTTGIDNFYGGEIGTVNMACGFSSASLISIRVKDCGNNYKRDVDFVRSILPELEVMLSKVNAYRELAI
jgi:hypothetical protein